MNRIKMIAAAILAVVAVIAFIVIVFPADNKTPVRNVAVEASKNTDVPVTGPESRSETVEYASDREESEVTPTAETDKALPSDPDPVSRVKDALERGDYNEACKGVVFCGDSIVKALDEYGILNEESVMAYIGARTGYIAKRLNDIVEARPEFLVLHFGENHMDEKPYADSFASGFAKAINNVRNRLPGVKIIVDSIFPVTDRAVQREPFLANIDHYNSKLREMAKEQGVIFADFTPMWRSFGERYYDVDGIHPVRAFYTERYLPYLLLEVCYPEE